MSKNVAVFVDVANLYYSARGQDVDVDYVALLKTATKGRDLIRAYAYSGLDPENENQRKFIDFLGKNGYKVLTKDIRKFGDGRVKANLDIELVVDLFRLADRMDIAVIVSGDGDFAPAIRALQDKGVRCEVISFRPNTSSDLMAVTDEFTDIMKIAGIGRGTKDEKPDAKRMSAPEMPAKEVVPEFGFREASPGVAKAALAALREGRGSNGERGRRRGRSTAASTDEAPEAAAAEAAAPVEAAAADGNGAPEGEGEQRRRRRRRGGRGRGRGRGRSDRPAEEATAGAADGEGEIGWVELDDLSQLDELDGDDVTADREYTFEEADEATLAELGINVGEASTGAPLAAEEGGEAEPKKPARRSRARKAAAKPAPAEAADAGADAEPKKPARRRATSSTRTARSRTKKDDAASQPSTGESKDEPAADKPKAGTKSASRGRARSTTARTSASGEGQKEAKPATRRSRATKTRQDAAEGGSGEDTEGIWQRFRSARGTKQPS